MMKFRMAANMGLLSLCFTGLVAVSPAGAQANLVGAYLFGANSSGATTGTGYQYDTNLNSAAYALSVNGIGKGFSTPLTLGVNSFSFRFTTGAVPPGANGDLGLFFSPSNSPYSPSNASRTPDLIVSATANGGVSFFTPTAGTIVNDYHFGSSALAANGLTSFVIGGDTISVSAYSVTSTPAGTFTLDVAPTVAPTPEPGAVSLLMGIGVSGGLLAIRKRTAKK